MAYILKLLANLKSGDPADSEKRKKEIVDLLAGEANLRSKRELIEKFIQDNLPGIDDAEDIPEEFDKFWTQQQQAAFNQLCEEEKLVNFKVERVIENYLFSEQEPLRDDVLDLIEGDKPSILERKTVGERILTRIRDFVETFMDGMLAQ